MTNNFESLYQYESQYREDIEIDEIQKIRNQRLMQLNSDRDLQEIISDLNSLPRFQSKHLMFEKNMVEIGLNEELTSSQKKTYSELLKKLIPWKKGPFKLFGEEIDAEWRSDCKWDRIKPQLSPLKGKRIADIGCNNGYFMFRMAAEDPELVVGFEPYSKNLLAFECMHRFTGMDSLQYELLGVEHINLYPQFFDIVFCLGILYHHTDPMSLLRKIKDSMNSKGQLIVECQGIPGDDSIALVPKGRYAQARGIWFLPTAPCLVNWLTRAGFQDIEVFFNEPLSTTEQRSTTWAPYKSLCDFLDPQNSDKTIEGYPAPSRIYLKAHKP